MSHGDGSPKFEFNDTSLSPELLSDGKKYPAFFDSEMDILKTHNAR